MKRKLFWAVCMLPFFVGCNKTEHLSEPVIVGSESELESYQSRYLQGDNLDFKEHSLIGAFDLLFQNDTLVVCYSSGRPYYFDALSVSQEKYLASFIKEGGGPGEYLGLLMSSFSKPDDGRISIAQRGYDGDLIEYKLSELIENPDAPPTNRVSFSELDGFMRLMRLDENTLVSSTFRSNTLLTILDGNGNRVDHFLSYPFTNDMTHISDNALSLAFQSNLILNSKGRIGVFSMTSPNWDIVEYKNGAANVINSVHLRKPEVVDQSKNENGQSINSIAFLESNKDGFIDVCNTDEFIYALYSGKSYEDYGNDVLISSNVLVFNWNGELVDKLELDKEAKAIEVANDELLLVLIEESENSYIRKYMLE